MAERKNLKPKSKPTTKRRRRPAATEGYSYALGGAMAKLFESMVPKPEKTLVEIDRRDGTKSWLAPDNLDHVRDQVEYIEMITKAGFIVTIDQQEWLRIRSRFGYSDKFWCGEPAKQDEHFFESPIDLPEEK